VAATVSTFAGAVTVSAIREWRFLRASPWDLALATWLPGVCMVTVAWLLNAGVVRELPVAVVDDDRSAISRELTRLVDATPALAVTARPATLAAAWPLVRSGDVYAVVYVPWGATRDIARGGTATVFVYYDATHSTAAQAAYHDAGAAVQAMSARIHGRTLVRPSPVLVQASTAGNPAPSYEGYLLGLLLPVIVMFSLCLSVTGAFGRELRDGTARAWLRASGDALLPAAVGKTAPYLALAGIEGVAALTWIAGVRGYGVHGNVVMLGLGLAALLMAYAAVAVLFVALTREMGEALVLTNLFAGTALAYSGTTFPLDGAPLFAVVWNSIVPFATYARLQTAQMSAGAPWSASVRDLVILSLFVVIPGFVGLRLYERLARR
jgi:ABC-2 type transport system permease protein